MLLPASGALSAPICPPWLIPLRKSRIGRIDLEAGRAARHRSLDTLRGYVRRVDLFREHAGALFL
jgi:hypothetical protein